MEEPLVSCIMPTYSDRQVFIPYAIDYFLHQDYPNAELLILDDGLEPVYSKIPDHPRIHYHHTALTYRLGILRNICCLEAKGEIIMHWDDDDWYAQDWISKQVKALISSGADITGLNNINFFSTQLNKIWKYRDTNTNPWVYGATLAYWKSFWEKHPFKEMNAGEDNDFIWSSGAKIHAHEYTAGYLGIVHTENAGIQWQEDPRHKRQLTKWLKKIEKPLVYKKNNKVTLGSDSPMTTCIMPTANRPNFISSAIDYFLKQDYLNKELVIIDDGIESVKSQVPTHPAIRYFYFKPSATIGKKRNIACEKAKGKLITHWYDDDWYAPDWLSHQVEAITNSEADICGINQVQFFSPTLNTYWMTKNSDSKRPWLSGQSLIYWKSFWEKHPFKDLQIGEDDDFIRSSGARICTHDYFQGFIATLHPHNTSLKFFEDPKDKMTN